MGREKQSLHEWSKIWYVHNVVKTLKMFSYFLLYNVDVFVVDFKNSAQLSAIIFVQ